MKTTIDLKCIFTDLHLSVPTKQFTYSKKETRNARLIIASTDAEQIHILNDAIMQCKTEGLKTKWQNVNDYPNGLVYPMTNEKLSTQIVACTFFELPVMGADGKQLDASNIGALERKGSFYGIANISFYPYANGNRYGIGTNINSIQYLSDYKPDDAEQHPAQLTEQEQEKMNTATTPNHAGIEKCIKSCALEYATAGTTYKFVFDLMDVPFPNKTFIMVQEQAHPDVLNVALYDAKYFDLNVFGTMMPRFIAELENGNMREFTTPDALANDLYKYTMGEFKE